MKKIICLLLCLCLAVSVCGCVGVPKNSENSGIETEANVTDMPADEQDAVYPEMPGAPFELISGLYESEGFSLSYPQVKDNTHEVNQKINAVIFEDVVKVKDYFQDVNNVSLELDYQTELVDGHVLSIIYTGSASSDDMARPVNICRTENIDINSGKRVVLGDVLTIDSRLAQVLKSDKAEFFDEQSRTQVSALSDEDLVSKLSLADRTDGIHMNNLPTAYSFYVQDKIGIILFDDSFEIDYIEIEIPADAVVDLLK